MEYLYPGGLAKAITFSYDDGQVIYPKSQSVELVYTDHQHW